MIVEKMPLKDIKYLYTAGCSIAYGSELQEELNSKLPVRITSGKFHSTSNNAGLHYDLHRRKNKFSNIVARYFGWYDLNSSIPGNSNLRIILDTISFIERFKNHRDLNKLFILLQLSEESRFPVFAHKINKVLSIVPFSHKVDRVDDFREEYLISRTILKDHLSFIDDNYFNYIISLYSNVILLDQLCRKYKIRYLIIPLLSDTRILDFDLSFYKKNIKNNEIISTLEDRTKNINFLSLKDNEYFNTFTLIEKIHYNDIVNLKENYSKDDFGKYNHPLSRIHKLIADKIIRYIELL